MLLSNYEGKKIIIIRVRLGDSKAIMMMMVIIIVIIIIIIIIIMIIIVM